MIWYGRGCYTGVEKLLKGLTSEKYAIAPRRYTDLACLEIVVISSYLEFVSGRELKLGFFKFNKDVSCSFFLAQLVKNSELWYFVFLDHFDDFFEIVWIDTIIKVTAPE